MYSKTTFIGFCNLIKESMFFSQGLPAVITITAYFPDVTTDGVPLPEAYKRLEKQGAAVVGLNCGRGPMIN